MTERSILAAVSGIDANQTYLDNIANNIANSNTVGYKDSSLQFQDLLAQQLSSASAPTANNTAGVNPVSVGSGVRVAASQINLSEGSLEQTGQPTDVAIQGNGYLVLDSGGQQFYTRNGSLTIDANGNLASQSGGLVQGWMANGSGVINTSAPVSALKIPTGESIPAQATTSLTLGGNLPAWDGVGIAPSVTSTISAYDSLGNPVPVTLTFTGVSGVANEWTVQGTVTSPTGTSESLWSAASLPRIVFDPASGSIASTTPAELVGSALPASTTITTGTNDTLNVTVNGTPHTLTLAAGTYTPTQLVAALNSAITAAGAPMSASLDAGGAVQLDTTASGSSASLALTAGDALTSLGLTTASASGGYGVLIPSGGSGAVTQNPDGSLSLAVGAMPAGYTFPNGDTLSFDFPAATSAGAVTQFAGQQTLAIQGQNGHASGTLQSFSIGSDGVIRGSFSSGTTLDLGQIALASFTNPAGLADQGGGLLASTANSGQAGVGAPGSGSRGTLLGGELEQSNVNLGSELTDLIGAQEAYQANTKVLSSTQQVIQALESVA